MPLSCTQIIKHFNLSPLPLEGGYYRRNYESTQTIDLGKGHEQPLGTSIYFLLTTDTFSAFHWLFEDEIYHFYLGDPIELFEISQEGELRTTILGPDILNKQKVQHPVLSRRWHGSRLAGNGKWALIGTTMAPGFHWDDFKLGKREELLAHFPAHKNIIEQLTRA